MEMSSNNSKSARQLGGPATAAGGGRTGFLESSSLDCSGCPVPSQAGKPDAATDFKNSQGSKSKNNSRRKLKKEKFQFYKEQRRMYGFQPPPKKRPQESQMSKAGQPLKGSLQPPTPGAKNSQQISGHGPMTHQATQSEDKESHHGETDQQQLNKIMAWANLGAEEKKSSSNQIDPKTIPSNDIEKNTAMQTDNPEENLKISGKKKGSFRRKMFSLEDDSEDETATSSKKPKLADTPEHPETLDDPVTVIDRCHNRLLVTKKKWHLIDKTLLEALVEGFDSYRKEIQFENMSWHSGYKIFSCSTPESLEFTKDIISKCNVLMPDSKLEVIPVSRLFLSRVVTMWVPAADMELEKILKIIKIQNDMDIDQWKVLESKLGSFKNGTFLKVLIDQESARRIRNSGAKIKFGLAKPKVGFATESESTSIVDDTS